MKKMMVISVFLFLFIAVVIYAEGNTDNPAQWETIVNKIFSVAIYIVVIGMLIGVLSLRKIKRSYGSRPPAPKSWSGFSGSSGGVPYGDGFKAFHSDEGEDDK